LNRNLSWYSAGLNSWGCSEVFAETTKSGSISKYAGDARLSTEKFRTDALTFESLEAQLICWTNPNNICWLFNFTITHNSASLAFLLTTFFVLLTIGDLLLHRMASYGTTDENLWYVGKGAKEDTYLKYRIQHSDINDGQSFNMTLYFDELDSTGTYWIAPVFVEYQGKVLNGTFHLRDKNLYALKDSAIPANMTIYNDAYRKTLVLLFPIADKTLPRSLDASHWDRIFCSDCAGIDRLGAERITVPAGTFDTTIMGHNSTLVHVKIWINKDLPYPIKEDYDERYENLSSKPTLAKFELLEIGEGYPRVIPEFTSGASSMNIALTIAAMIGSVAISAIRFKRP
jgi:hypothetical protein